MDKTQFHKPPHNCEINFNSQTRSRFSFIKVDLLLLFLLVISVIIVYSISIKGPFVFDDTFNIRDNPNIRLSNITIDGIINAGFNSYSSRRPVANISFALNYFLNGYDVEGYHLINILIHIITGIVLFYLIKVTLELLNAHNLKLQLECNAQDNYRSRSVYNSTNSNIAPLQRIDGSTSTKILFTAFFTTFIWLVHPLQTQTVSYIVQRMNCMAAMFYILSLLFYIKARLTNSKRVKLVLFVGCIFSGILSLGSKEISATLPLFIFLYEWYFFQDISLKWLKRNLKYFLFLFIIIIFVALFFLDGHPIKNIFSGYNHRNFTLWQRVLTEFRVVIYYISLIIFPHPMRLNLLHDFPISHSFIDPITTLVSFIIIVGMMVTAIWLAKKEPLLSFSILWFLGNLVIESSVLGLEVIFEHRVYLPSMFFILLFVSLIYRFANSKCFWSILLCAIGITLSIWTYQRNIVWSDDVILWEDCVKKSPNKPRQHYNLGVVLARKGKLNDAIKHYIKAIKIKPDYLEAYYNLGNVFVRKGDVEAAIYNYQKALQINPSFFKAYYNIARILSNQGKTDEAIYNYQEALAINSETPQTLYNLSWIYATSIKRRYRDGIKAIKLAEKLCILTDYRQPLALDALAAAYAENGNFDKAIEIAKKALLLANQVGPKELIFGLKKRLELYQIGRPYRQSLK